MRAARRQVEAEAEARRRAEAEAEALRQAEAAKARRQAEAEGMDNAWSTLEERLGLSSASAAEQSLRVELAKKDEALAEKDEALVKQGEELARLRAQLESVAEGIPGPQ